MCSQNERDKIATLKRSFRFKIIIQHTFETKFFDFGTN